MPEPSQKKFQNDQNKMDALVLEQEQNTEIKKDGVKKEIQELRTVCQLKFINGYF